jgi:hypothetical protein
MEIFRFALKKWTHKISNKIGNCKTPYTRYNRFANELYGVYKHLTVGPIFGILDEGLDE